MKKTIPHFGIAHLDFAILNPHSFQEMSVI